MSQENHRIEKYQYEERVSTLEGVTSSLGLLYLYGAGNSLIAAIAFVPDGEELDRPSASASGHINVQMSNSRQPTIIDILRNEKPLFFSWAPERESACISTHAEPVGEQELRKLFSWLYV